MLHSQIVECTRNGNFNLAKELVEKMIATVEGKNGIDASEHKLKMFFELGIEVKGEIDTEKFLEVLKKTDELSMIQKYEKINNLKKAIQQAQNKLVQLQRDSERTVYENRLETYSKLLGILMAWQKELKAKKTDKKLIDIYYGK